MDPLRGWGRLAGGGVTLRYAEGSHTSILRPPHAASLAATLTATLQEAQDQQGSHANDARSG
jgi:thioesterase domain-containing protein